MKAVLDSTDIGAGATQLHDGAISVIALATDSAGNVSVAGTTSFTLDTTAPTARLLPLNNATIVAGANFVLEFNENVVLGSSGTVEVVDHTAATTTTINLTNSNQVTFSNNTLTINPTADLIKGHSYHLLLSSGFVRDTSGNDWAGISSDSDWEVTVSDLSITLEQILVSAGTGSGNKLGQTINKNQRDGTLTLSGYIDSSTTDISTAIRTNSITVTLVKGMSTVNATVSSYSDNTGEWVATVAAGAFSSAIDGEYTVNVAVSVTPTMGGSTFTANTSGTVTVDATPPTVSLGLAANIDDGATRGEATQGVITVSTENGARVAIEFSKGTNVLNKTFTSAGSSQTVVLNGSDIGGASGLPDGTISVVVFATDTVGNATTDTIATSFTLDTVAPTVTSVAITAATGVQNAFVNVNDVVTATVTMSEAVNVLTTSGTPQLALNIGGSTKQASYASGTGN